jgi:hypothetical protein
MGNIKGRLARLENRAWVRGNIAMIVIMPGETREQAREKYYVANPKCKEANTEEVFFRVEFIEAKDGRPNELP